MEAAFPLGRRNGVKFVPDPKPRRGCYCFQLVLNRVLSFILCQYSAQAAVHEESGESFIF